MRACSYFQAITCSRVFNSSFASSSVLFDLPLIGAAHAGIMVSKIDQCMLDLMKFHGEGEEPGLPVEQEPIATASATVTASSQAAKATDTNRMSAGNRLASHRPQSPLSDSDVSEASQLSQSPLVSDMPPLAKASPKSVSSAMGNSDDKYL